MELCTALLWVITQLSMDEVSSLSYFLTLLPLHGGFDGIQVSLKTREPPEKSWEKLKSKKKESRPSECTGFVATHSKNQDCAKIHVSAAKNGTDFSGLSSILKSIDVSQPVEHAVISEQFLHRCGVVLPRRSHVSTVA